MHAGLSDPLHYLLQGKYLAKPLGSIYLKLRKLPQFLITHKLNIFYIDFSTIHYTPFSEPWHGKLQWFIWDSDSWNNTIYIISNLCSGIADQARHKFILPILDLHLKQPGAHMYFYWHSSMIDKAWITLPNMTCLYLYFHFSQPKWYRKISIIPSAEQWIPLSPKIQQAAYHMVQKNFDCLKKLTLNQNITAFKNKFWMFKGAYKLEWNQLFTWSDSDKRRGNGFILK